MRDMVGAFLLRIYDIILPGRATDAEHIFQPTTPVSSRSIMWILACCVRRIRSLRRASGAVLETSTDAFGRRVLTYDGIPCEVDDHIHDNEVKGTSTDCSSIYAVQFGFQTGLCGLQNKSIQVQPLGALETKDAWRTRIKWYCGLALFRDIALARLEGVRI